MMCGPHIYHPHIEAIIHLLDQSTACISESSALQIMPARPSNNPGKAAQGPEYSVPAMG